MAQLEAADIINQRRLALWHRYASALAPLDGLTLPSVSATCLHNAHMFYVKLRDIDDSDGFIRYLKAADILSVFHYIPLHDSPSGCRFGRFHGSDRHTQCESQRLVRLPLFYNLSDDDQQLVIDATHGYFN